MKLKKTRWQIKDLIDLEYFLHIDADDATQNHGLNIDTRDRDIFLKYIQPRLPEIKSLPRRFIIKDWLDRRRELEKKSVGVKTILPGEAFSEISRFMGYGLFILGGLSGIGLAVFLLTYTGTAPLNISAYLGTTVFVQILLLLLLGGLLLIRMIRPQRFYSSVIYTLLSNLIIALAGKLKQRIMKSLSGAQREGLSAVTGLMRGKKQIYGSLFYWPVFIIAQLYGIGFNLGVLGTTLLRVIGADLAFGWQSTLQVSAKAVYGIIKWLAVPWSWFVSPDLAYPSLSQIEGSRLVLKDGIYHLSTPDLVAWWPFLCFAVLFYGLLPRIVLFVFGRMTQKYLLNRIELTHSNCDQLVDRMVTPRIQFNGTKEFRSTTTSTGNVDETLVKVDNASMDKKFIVLIPDDIFEVGSGDELDILARQSLGGKVVDKIRIDNTDTDDAFTPEHLIPAKAMNDWTHILILKEAWQPPIMEDITFIRTLRHYLGDSTPILVGLIGKPRHETIYTQVSAIDWRTWKEKFTALGDPYLRIERLVHETNMNFHHSKFKKGND